VHYSDFSSLLEDRGIDPQKTKLLRHTEDGAKAWRRGKDWLGSYISIQSRPNSPFKQNPLIACHFIPDNILENGSHTARLVGVTNFIDRWPWQADRLPRLWLPDDFKNPNHDNEAVDQEWSNLLQDCEGWLIVNWGQGARAWHQWAHKKRKQLLTEINADNHLLDEAIDFDNTLTGYEERTWREHARLERSKSYSNAIKALRDLKCEGCGLDAEAKYGNEIATACIEAHHKTPLSQLAPGKKRQIDLHKDFVLLCATCHRIIHRLSDPSDLAGLRKLVLGSVRF